GEPRREPRRHELSSDERLPEPEKQVIRKDHRDADDKARQLRVATIGRAEGQPDQPEHEAGCGYRVPLIKLEYLVVWRLTCGSHTRNTLAQLGHRHFTQTLRDTAHTKHAGRIDVQDEVVASRHHIS